MNLPYLHHDLVLEIFNYIPCKSASRCRCLARFSRYELEDLYFIDKQSQNSKKVAPKLLLIDTVGSVMQSDIVHRVRSPPRVVWNTLVFNQVHAACDGFVMLVSPYERIFLANPLKKELRHIPYSCYRFWGHKASFIYDLVHHRGRNNLIVVVVSFCNMSCRRDILLWWQQNGPCIFSCLC